MPSALPWNWQLPDWPSFRHDSSALAALEATFLRQSGVLAGALRHVAQDEQQQLVIELIGEEALRSSEIEGELLDRDSLQSSLRRHFGLAADHRRVPPAEQGIAQLMVELYRQHDAPLTTDLLCHWHQLLMQGRRDLIDLGRYRRAPHPMQVVSGPVAEPRVHFEAPPAAAVPAEMTAFLHWYGQPSRALPLLTRAGIAHLYFVSIHPFEDGNGRLGRAIAEKALSEGLGHAALIALSATIQAQRRSYYEQLHQASRTNEITPWLIYFAETALAAQARAVALVEFIIAKAALYRRLHGQLNERQEKALARLFREGPAGFKGGLSAENYIRITSTSRATATRDLQDLVDKQALTRTGERRGTRYWLRV